jgi:predicted RNase H-like HicB family nuclease
MAGVLGRGFDSRRLHQILISLRLQLESLKDGDWFVGRLPQVPSVFSQGATREKLEENIRDAYRIMMEQVETAPFEGTVLNKDIEVSA